MKKIQKNLGGRPKKPDSERRSAKLDFVRVSPAEVEYLEKQAEKQQKRVAEWVREKLGLKLTGYGGG